MLARVGTLEWVIVLVIALLIFGPGRITKLAGELGHSIQAFQEGLKEEKPEDNEDETI
ncbi:MAG TPA: twin-arginine translocase TatA/TatE family subunit [Thermoflexia bacterium]|nr:twin-arginine translocase TatA/TatE family subunit [Thermoflexia bacterium]